MCLANAFSGGVFLAMSIMFIIPEASELYEEWRMEEGKHSQDQSFSLPFILVFVGYTLILLIDKVIFNTNSLFGSHGHDHKEIQNSKNCIRDENNGSHVNQENKDEEEENNECPSKNHCFVARMSEALKIEENKENPESTKIPKIDCENPKIFQNIGPTMSKGTSEEPKSDSFDKMKLFNLTSIALMVGLSTHSVFDGIVVGLEDELSKIWSYVIAISLHKWAASMSLGISMSKSFKNQRGLIAILMGIFSLATPLGIGIGMLVSGKSNLAEIIFNSLTAGTFIYIACSEVIAEEFADPKNKYLKMTFYLFGAVLISVINHIEI